MIPILDKNLFFEIDLIWKQSAPDFFDKPFSSEDFILINQKKYSNCFFHSVIGITMLSGNRPASGILTTTAGANFFYL